MLIKKYERMVMMVVVLMKKDRTPLSCVEIAEVWNNQVGFGRIFIGEGNPLRAEEWGEPVEVTQKLALAILEGRLTQVCQTINKKNGLQAFFPGGHERFLSDGDLNRLVINDIAQDL